ncbi:hypothetical protein [Streptomyces sp. NPDC007984]|uniref:hypothetical protein n=1 Tax=Streptomyces sp. NPDC007984 TaxID=3364801 RepID=UPI0036EA911F
MQRTEGDRGRRRSLADMANGGQMRLLPWENERGKPCYLNTDGGPSALARLADEMETVQLGIGADVLREASRILDDPMSPNAEVRYAGVRLAECLRDALRVAESRGMRLPVPDDQDDENGPQTATQGSAGGSA